LALSCMQNSSLQPEVSKKESEFHKNRGGMNDYLPLVLNHNVLFMYNNK